MGWLSRLFRPKEIQDARVTQPVVPSQNAFHYFPRKRGGIIVTHEKALELATCFGCCRAISEDIAKLPWNVFTINNNRRTRLDGSRLHILLNTRPNPNMTSFTFRETMMMWALTWGNGYAEIERDLAGRPVALWPISPDRVEPRRDLNGEVYYEISNQRQQKSLLFQRDMFHIHGVGWDGLEGYSIIALAAQTLGFGLATEEHGSNFFGNNTTIGLSLATDMALGEQAYARLREEMDKKKGSANAFEGMILEQGLKFAYPNMNMVDSQYAEIQRNTVEEICRWFRVPPHKVAELSRAHFANVENLNIDYATDTLMPWVKRMEEEADWKLISSRSRPEYTKIALGEIMRGDSAARAKWYKDMSQIGFYSINEMRELEDMDPIGPEGDEHFMQMQYTTLRSIVDQAEDVEENPEDDMSEPVERQVARLFSTQSKKATLAAQRYSKEEYASWLTKQQKDSLNRYVAAYSDVIKVVKTEVTAETLAFIYADAERAQLFNLYDNQPVNESEIVAKLMEAIHAD